MYKKARCIAHEIRNHISVCELYTHVIKRNLEKEGLQNESLENAINCITKSLQIMNTSLLDLKNLDNIELKVCDFKLLIEEAVNLSKAYCFGKNIDIKISNLDNIKINVDENKYIACIVNIIKNAIEAIENNGVIIISSSIAENFVSLKISNNGPMISFENQTKLFDSGFTTKQIGSGLGLNICYEDLKHQNSSLSLVSSTPEMTEFEIKTPIV